MEKEFIKETQHSVTLNVTAGRIDSFREIEKTTGLTVVAPALNLQYLIKISARACDEPIGSDDIFHMNLSDFNHVRNMARNFMLRSDR